VLYAIVDIETTGSYAAGAGITEVAVIIHDGTRELQTWQSLVNPKRPIPRMIQQLTGINDDMVRNAPTFAELAPHIHSLLQDKIFVAHNVNFDYSFIKHHLKEAGLNFDQRKLCTLRLARKIKPGLSHYGLGRLCFALGIQHENPHRAYGDAAATALLLRMLVAEDVNGEITTMLKGRGRDQYLPPNLPREQVDSLPEVPGVYYFYNGTGKLIYVGKAVNLLKRVKSHFSNNKSGRQKQDFLREIHRISYRLTGTDLLAQVLESVEIRRLWPIYNRSQRGYLPKYALYAYEDQTGYLRLALNTHKLQLKPLYTFNALVEGQSLLRRLVDGFGLCPRLCHLSKDIDCRIEPAAWGCNGLCSDEQHVSDYNERVGSALTFLAESLPTMVFIDEGRDENEQSFALIEDGVFRGLGYFPIDTEMYELDFFRASIESMPDNDFVRNLIYRYAAEFPEKCLYWEGGEMRRGGLTGNAPGMWLVGQEMEKESVFTKNNVEAQ
jgi:DNA polymerase-3 subunit epsilon